MLWSLWIPKFRLMPVLLIAVAGTSTLSANLQLASTSTTSRTEAGYLEMDKSSYTNVHANFKVLAISCGGEVSEWSGMDANGIVAQTGVDSYCASGVAYYYPWYEFYPAPSHAISYGVHPGDSMTTAVHNDGGGYFTTTLTDHTRGWTSSHRGYTGGHGATLEVLIENNTGTLANFGTVAFTDVTADGSGMGNYSWVKYNMTDSSGYHKATTNAWYSSGYDFSITWNRCC